MTFHKKTEILIFGLLIDFIHSHGSSMFSMTMSPKGKTFIKIILCNKCSENEAIKWQLIGRSDSQGKKQSKRGTQTQVNISERVKQNNRKPVHPSALDSVYGLICGHDHVELILSIVCFKAAVI